MITSFDIIAKNARKGAIRSKELTALWFQYDLNKGLLVPESDLEAEQLERIKAFVAEFCPKTQPENQLENTAEY
jgi:hypothetical protein